MTREKALEAMDKLVPLGYTVTIGERDMGDHGHVIIAPDGAMTSIHRWVEVSAFSFDKVDIRALVKAADDLELDINSSRLSEGRFQFVDQPTEAEQRKREVVGGRRQHPR